MQENEDAPEQLNLFGSQAGDGEALEQRETKQEPLISLEPGAFYKAQREASGSSELAAEQKSAPPAAKKKRVIFMRGLILFAIALVAGTVIFHPVFVYQGYRQGSCIIQSESIQNHQGKNGPYYTLSIAYDLQTQDGRHISTSGYEAPAAAGGQQYSSYNEAQQIVNSYAVAGIYHCWYDPADPTRAALVFHGYTFNQALVPYISITPILFVMLILLFAPLYTLVYLPLRLLTRGVRTQGQATEHFMKSIYNQKSGKTAYRPYSRIVFQLQSDPPLSRSLEVSGTLPIGSQQPVLYDPTNPENAQRGGVGCMLSFGLALCIFILALILVLLFIMWSM